MVNNARDEVDQGGNVLCVSLDISGSLDVVFGRATGIVVQRVKLVALDLNEFLNEVRPYKTSTSSNKYFGHL